MYFIQREQSADKLEETLPVQKGEVNMDEMNSADLTKELVNNQLEIIAKLVKADAKTLTN